MKSAAPGSGAERLGVATPEMRLTQGLATMSSVTCSQVTACQLPYQCDGMGALVKSPLKGKYQEPEHTWGCGSMSGCAGVGDIICRQGCLGQAREIWQGLLLYVLAAGMLGHTCDCFNRRASLGSAIMVTGVTGGGL